MKKHYAIIFLAIFVAMISSVPQYIATKSAPNFQGIYRSPANDGLYYEARVRDVIDGHPFLSNPYLSEYKNSFPMQFWLPDYLMAKGIVLMHVSVPIGFIIWTAILEFIIVLLSYAISFALTESRKWSFLSALLFNLGFFNGTFLRIPSPGFNFVFWLTTFLFLILFIKTQKDKYAVLSAISFGMLFHLYTYFWTFYVVVFGIFLVLVFALRRFNSLKKWLLILLGALIIGIPYFISQWQAAHLPSYAESIARVGMISTHFPSGIDSVIYAFILAIVFLIFYFRKYVAKDTLTIFLFSGVLSAAIVVNQHIITGKNLEFSSHYFLPNTVWFFFSGLFLVYVFINKQNEKIQKVFFLSLLVVAVIFAFVKTGSLLKIETYYSPEDIYAQNYIPVFDWLNQNAKKDDVVYANDDLNNYIPIYTSQNILSSPFAILFFMSNVEAENRFIINHYFDSLTLDFILKNQRSIYGAFYLDQYDHNQSKNKLREIFGLKPVQYDFVPDSVLQNTISDAQVIQKQKFNYTLHSYQVDYIVWDKNKNPDWKLNDFIPVYSANNFVIYKVK